jgi:serine/threonine protein kinase/formylglycine-generating enzyme required for sulfatase activity
MRVQQGGRTYIIPAATVNRHDKAATVTSSAFDDTVAERNAPTSPLSSGDSAVASGDAAPPGRGGDEDAAPSLPGRYEDLGILARGGFGEVRRVRDTVLDRELAMKILHRELSAWPQVRMRFFMEVQITAQLQHPGIVPVYDHGELPDGRLWYAMRNVRGTTLGAIVRELHAASAQSAWGTTASGWTFRRAVDAFARIAQTVAYAHGRGVMHRDIKPENLMAGELGEVLVMDWGLARRIADRPGAEETGLPESLDEAGPLQLTSYGDVLGTPAYMPPEQARGARDQHGSHSDVYALGAVLYELLAGRAPYSGSGREVVRAILRGPPEPLLEAAKRSPPIPEELARACERAMTRDVHGRGSADELASDMVAWLDGVRRREQAMAVLERARALVPEIARLREGAGRALSEARARLASLQPFDPVAAKRPAWRLEDEAAELGRSAALVEARWLQTVHGALVLDGDLPEAHAMLADHYRNEVVRAERAHEAEDAARFEEMLRAHDRGQHEAFLRGDGAVSLVTEPPGARVALHRYVLSDRRLTPVFERDLGLTPLRQVPVSRGSYLLVIRAPGLAEVRYPVLVERDGHWDGVAPGGSGPRPIRLPPEGELGLEDILVPAGWCWTGGDSEAGDSLPSQRIWVEAFVIRRRPVTLLEYVEFVNDLVTSGRDAEAVAAAPQSDLGADKAGGRRLFLERGSGGRFALPGAGGDPAWQPDMPVVQIDWHAASAYAQWLSSRTGRSWRLPNELEREKAARGADGRLFPWGDHGDATFARVVEGQPGQPAPEPAGAHPVDESPYGVRGLAGNVRDWCINLWRRDGPRVTDGRLDFDAAPPDDLDFRAVRGGFWANPITNSRSTYRFGARPREHRSSVGLRLVRDF